MPPLVELALGITGVVAGVKLVLIGADHLRALSKLRIENARAARRLQDRLALARRFEDVVAIVIADEAMADMLREKIDARHPRVRVEDDDEEQRDERGRFKRRSR
jgi:dihydrodipicolinate synthase/N-acetylneuraminate lyase